MIEKIKMPRKLFSIKFFKSSGNGGQNVNKVSTKVFVKIPINKMKFLDEDAMRRFKTKFKHKINNKEEFFHSCEEERTQNANLEKCFDMIENMVQGILVKPKKRYMNVFHIFSE